VSAFTKGLASLADHPSSGQQQAQGKARDQQPLQRPAGSPSPFSIEPGRSVGFVKKSKVSQIRVGFVSINDQEYIVIRGWDKASNSKDDWVPRAGITIRLDLAADVADLLDRAIVEAEADGRLQLPDNGDEP
jgi:hypothetical protein